jgi:GNAT superfamily N-acetyltransferase
MAARVVVGGAAAAAAEPFFGPRRKPGDVLVAVSDGTILGYARLGRHLPVAANEHVLHFEALAVSPDARGRGVGSLFHRANRPD